MRYKFDDESVQDTGLKFPKVDLKKDEIARGCLISPYFEVTVRHWVSRMGYVHCHAVRTAKEFKDLLTLEKEGGSPTDCLMCDMALKPDTQDAVALPKVHYATYFLRYHTNTKGEVLQGQLGFHLEIWLMGAKKYREIIAMQKEWGKLQDYDLELNCTEAKYQNMDIGLKKEALWRKLSKENQIEVVEYVKAEVEKYPLISCLGDDIETEVLRRRFLVIKRRGFPDDEVDLSQVTEDTPVVMGDSAVGSGEAPPSDDPFGLGETDGKVPSVVSEAEKKEAQKVDSPASGLDELIP